MAERQLAQEEDDNFTFPVDDSVDLEDEELDSDQDDEGPGQSPNTPEPFTLSKNDPEPPGDKSQAGMADTEAIEIVHRGQVHRVTREKAIELAQKGFDYDVKVGPHARIAKLIDSDAGLAREIDAAIRRRMSGQAPQGPQPQPQQEPDPFSGMDDDEPITAAEARAELKRMAQMMKQQPRQMETSAPRQAGPPPIQMMLQGRDPENFNRVAPRLKEFARKLSVEDYQRIDTDPTAMIQFYDYVKSNIVGQDQQNTQQRTPATAGSFRARSGGGNPSRQKTPEQKIWEMPRAEFEKEMARFKSG